VNINHSAAMIIYSIVVELLCS